MLQRVRNRDNTKFCWRSPLFSEKTRHFWRPKVLWLVPPTSGSLLTPKISTSSSCLRILVCLCVHSKTVCNWVQFNLIYFVFERGEEESGEEAGGPTNWQHWRNFPSSSCDNCNVSKMSRPTPPFVSLLHAHLLQACIITAKCVEMLSSAQIYLRPDLWNNGVWGRRFAPSSENDCVVLSNALGDVKIIW